MNQTYSPAHDLHELADRRSDEASVTVAGDLVGVALPGWSSIQPCAILPPDTARKLGAQLLLAADELDAIQGAALGLGDQPTEPPVGPSDRTIHEMRGYHSEPDETPVR